MKFKILLILVAVAMTARVWGQGLVFNDQAYRQIPGTVYGEVGAKGEDPLLKNTYKVDLKPFCPSIKHQGSISSCVGWSVAYAAMTIEKAVKNRYGSNQDLIDENAFSPLFVYNQIKLADCDFGAELNQGLAFLKEKGNVLYRDFPIETNCDSVPAAQLFQKAKLNRLKDFTTLFQPDEKSETKIMRVKSSLVRNKPVVIGIVVLNNFLNLRRGDEMWYPNIGKTDLFGGHAMVVVGYDDGLKAFEVMNSWGKEWANDGYVWIRYDDFAHYCKYAYQLLLEEAGTAFLEGTLQMLKPAMKNFTGGESEVLFSPVLFSGKNYLYTLAGNDKRVPLQFQLRADAFKKDTYLYVISIDKDNNSSIEWPRNTKYNQRFRNEHDEGLIHSENSIILPDKYNLFSITSPGTEYICILNSSKPIKDLVKKTARLKGAKGDLRTRIDQVYQSISIEPTDVTVDKISFFTADSPNKVVAIILELATIE